MLSEQDMGGVGSHYYIERMGEFGSEGDRAGDGAGVGKISESADCVGTVLLVAGFGNDYTGVTTI